MVVSVWPCTSPRTCSALDGIRSLPCGCIGREKPSKSPRSLDGVRVGTGVNINELDAVVYSAMRVTLSAYIAVCSPRIANNRSAGFDPVTYDGHQCVGGSVRYGNKECFAGLPFNTTKHPPTFNRVFPMLLPPTELAVINLDCLVRTANFDGTAL